MFAFIFNPAHAVLRVMVALASWHWHFFGFSHTKSPKLKISFKVSPGYTSPADQACACWKSWEANGPTGSPWCVAAHANEFCVLLQWMATKGDWRDWACGHGWPVRLRGKMRLRYDQGCGRDELFSEHHTRGCQIAFLRAAAFPRTGLDRFSFLHLDGPFHPLNAHCMGTAFC